jgi:hypothetical protein
LWLVDYFLYIYIVLHWEIKTEAPFAKELAKGGKGIRNIK